MRSSRFSLTSYMGSFIRFFSISATLLLVVGSLGENPISAVPNDQFDYRDAVEKSLLFFDAQRSGKLPPDQPVTWRGDSALEDGFLQGVDLVGGYYDAGDHMKFGFPMAYAMTVLSWSVIEFRLDIAACGQLEHALSVIRWGTDYLIKAHTEDNTLWAQVGDGYSDHRCWERAEDMTTPRTAYKVDAEHPGSDIAGETAAAMAAASIVFMPDDLTYSDLLLSHAKQLFSFADTYRGRYDNSVPDVREYYPSLSGYNDELLWAAAWLFEATKEDYYMEYIVNEVASMDDARLVVREFSWEIKYAGFELLLTKVLMLGGNEAYNETLNQLKAKVELFLCACLQKNDPNNIAMTPGGLLYFNEWSNMQYVSSSAFLLSVYAEYLSIANASLTCSNGQMQPHEILKFAQSQVDYILGKNSNSMSYMVGYQGNYPAHVHHRGASIPSASTLDAPVGCIEGYQKWYSRKESNPNVVVGALVGGPNWKDEFYDQRSNYAHNEPSIAGNAPLMGLFARMDGLSRDSGYSLWRSCSNTI